MPEAGLRASLCKFCPMNFPGFPSKRHKKSFGGGSMGPGNLTGEKWIPKKEPKLKVFPECTGLIFGSCYDQFWYCPHHHPHQCVPRQENPQRLHGYDLKTVRCCASCKPSHPRSRAKKKAKSEIGRCFLGKGRFGTVHADHEDVIKMMKLMTPGEIGWSENLMLFQREEALMFDFAT